MARKELNSDYEIAEKLQKGDLDAFNRVFKKYSSRLYGFALKFLKSEVEAEGLVQKVFLKVWERRKDLKKEQSLKSYLFTIAYHDIIKIIRKKHIHLELGETFENSKKDSLNLEDQINYKFILEQVDQLIEKFPEKQRIVFIKSRKEGKSTREIAQELKLSQGTVNNYISASMKYLRTHISKNYLAFLLFYYLFL